MNKIEQILHPDPQQLPANQCSRCGAAVYAPDYHCSRCSREGATLRQISGDYAHAAAQLRERLRSLREQMALAEDPQARFALRQRIAVLTPILTEMNELAQLTAHYYDRGYYRDEKYTMQRICGPAVAKRRPAAANPHGDGQ